MSKARRKRKIKELRKQRILAGVFLAATLAVFIRLAYVLYSDGLNQQVIAMAVIFVGMFFITGVFLKPVIDQFKRRQVT